MEDLETEFQLAFLGREYWIGLKDRYEIDEYCFLILCPTDNLPLNHIAMENLVDFLMRKYIKRAVVLHTQPEVEEYYVCSANADVRFEQTGKKDMECILKYYRLAQFAKNIVVVSLDEPFGNEHIVGKKEITLTDYVKDAIYV